MFNYKIVLKCCGFENVIKIIKNVYYAKFSKVSNLTKIIMIHDIFIDQKE